MRCTPTRSRSRATPARAPTRVTRCHAAGRSAGVSAYCSGMTGSGSDTATVPPTVARPARLAFRTKSDTPRNPLRLGRLFQQQLFLGRHADVDLLGPLRLSGRRRGRGPGRFRSCRRRRRRTLPASAERTRRAYVRHRRRAGTPDPADEAEVRVGSKDDGVPSGNVPGTTPGSSRRTAGRSPSSCPQTALLIFRFIVGPSSASGQCTTRRLCIGGRVLNPPVRCCMFSFAADAERLLHELRVQPFSRFHHHPHQRAEGGLFAAPVVLERLGVLRDERASTAASIARVAHLPQAQRDDRVVDGAALVDDHRAAGRFCGGDVRCVDGDGDRREHRH